MDRFIVTFSIIALQEILYLKSNMDRFIDMLYDKVSNMFVI